MKFKDIKYATPITIALIVAFAIVGGVVIAGSQPPQQERRYTIQIPERLANAHLMLIRGQLDQLTAKDFRELLEIEEPQLYQQFRQYAYQDSVMRAGVKKIDTIKMKKP